MRSTPSSFGRRTMLSAMVSMPLVSACSTADSDAQQSNRPDPDLSSIERKYGVRLGVHGANIHNGQVVQHRENERFALCSTFKTYAAGALLHQHSLRSGFFDRRIHYSADELVDYSPVTSKHVDEGMTIRELCDAAVTHSDNSAGNQMLTLLGGPPGLTRFARSIGDRVTRLDRFETELNNAERGDERDTTSAAAIAGAYGSLVHGDVLGPAERAQLAAWLIANTTGDERIRAGLPEGWVTGDKTGTGNYATTNDIAVIWTDKRTPLVLAILSDKPDPDGEVDNALFVDVARVVADTLG